MRHGRVHAFNPGGKASPRQSTDSNWPWNPNANYSEDGNVFETPAMGVLIDSLGIIVLLFLSEFVYRLCLACVRGKIRFHDE